jgi:SAM-dependent methyltransferase
MNPEIRTALAELNRAFYARFAGDFARTRRTWPPGFDCILTHIRSASNLLDLGCGNARLLAFLAQRGWAGHYFGLDASRELLEIATENAGRIAAEQQHDVDQGIRPSARFVVADLLDHDWALSLGDFQPDVIVALAVLHHIPGADTRARFLADCAGLLQASQAANRGAAGRMIVSTWQFMSSPRLRQRILPWAVAGLHEADVEQGDYLLSWGQGAAGRRYCAAVACPDLSGLADRAGLDLVETFYADGHEGGLNLYGVLRLSSSVSAR